MSKQLSIRLDDAVHQELEADARARGVGLSTYLRDLAAEHARDVRRARIRAESERVGKLYRTSAQARDFYDSVSLAES
jgi:predicted DNA-binding protein